MLRKFRKKAILATACCVALLCGAGRAFADDGNDKLFKIARIAVNDRETMEYTDQSTLIAHVGDTIHIKAASSIEVTDGYGDIRNGNGECFFIINKEGKFTVTCHMNKGYDSTIKIEASDKKGSGAKAEMGGNLKVTVLAHSLSYYEENGRIHFADFYIANSAKGTKNFTKLTKQARNYNNQLRKNDKAVLQLDHAMAAGSTKVIINDTKKKDITCSLVKTRNVKNIKRLRSLIGFKKADSKRGAVVVLKNKFTVRQYNLKDAINDPVKGITFQIKNKKTGQTKRITMAVACSPVPPTENVVLIP